MEITRYKSSAIGLGIYLFVSSEVSCILLPGFKYFANLRILNILNKTIKITLNPNGSALNHVIHWDTFKSMIHLNNKIFF